MKCPNCLNYEPESSNLIIPSKYKVGDTVWVMQYNKAAKKVIKKILIDITESEYNVQYVLSENCGAYPESWMSTHAFKTKQELIESL